MSNGELDRSLSKNAKMDLRFHVARETGSAAPRTGRYAPEMKQDGYKCFMSNEVSSNLTTHWSHTLRGQKW